MAIHELLAQRWSSRRFAPDPLPDATIETLIEAARWAPSYGNRQPWRFVVAREPATLAALHGTLTRGNAYATVAPVLIALCGNPDNGQIKDGKQYYLMDAGMALENLLLQAVGLGLHAHPMGGFDEALVRDVLGIPETVHVLALIAVGRPGRLEDLDERTRERELRERTRKPAGAIRADERWAFGEDIDEGKK
ncbi:MAG TPA: nitroreductase family protein [Thermomicrobiales bacterium]|nr:nitroreductase family protein [Thermomicrobiales bacterium]